MPDNYVMTRQRALGQYMTPEPVAASMVREIRRPVAEWRVLDPACGDGNLLLAAAEVMQAAGIQDIPRRLMGLDIDRVMVNTARQRLSRFLACEEREVLVREGDFLQLTDTPLLGDPFASFDWFYNTVLSNPPYGQGREYAFFARCDALAPLGTELIFLVPLAFLDRTQGVQVIPLDGRPMGVTTGHAVVRHVAGQPFKVGRVRSHTANQREFDVLSGVKLYELGAGDPPQTNEILKKKPYSSPNEHPGWWPCVRTGDVQPFRVTLGRLWVDYGPHLAHPKDPERFLGPRLFVRRMPIWATRQLGAAYTDVPALCAGDVLVVRHREDDAEVLRGLSVYLNSPEAAEQVLHHRPSVRYRVSFPKISAKDLNRLLDANVPSDDELRNLARRTSE